MNLIVCVSRNWGIGKNNELLFHIPDDLKQFKGCGRRAGRRRGRCAAACLAR